MEYQKILNLVDNTPYQPSRFKTENWAEINYDSCGMYNNNYQVKVKTSMLKSSLCDNSNAYIHVKGTVTIPNTRTAAS